MKYFVNPNNANAVSNVIPEIPKIRNNDNWGRFNTMVITPNIIVMIDNVLSPLSFL